MTGPMTAPLRHLLLCTIAIAALATAQAQQLSEVPARTLRVAKAEVVSLAIAPKEDRILVGLNKGAELYDLEKGKRLHVFPYSEDGATVVYYVGFNANGEKVVLIGHSGKRTVWNVTNGEQEKVLRENLWIPEATEVRAMGLDTKNSAFDRFYQQTQVGHNGLVFRAAKKGVIEVVKDDKVIQQIAVPENKDQHHLAPILIFNGQLLAGTDDGRVLFYDLP